MWLTYYVENYGGYKVGHDIKVLVILRNGYNKQRNRGGDSLYIRTFNKGKKAYAAGRVIDHNNGTYTAIVQAHWPGEHTIEVTLAYRRERIRAIYYIRQKVKERKILNLFLKCSIKFHEDLQIYNTRSNYHKAKPFSWLVAQWHFASPKDNRRLGIEISRQMCIHTMQWRLIVVEL